MPDRHVSYSFASIFVKGLTRLHPCLGLASGRSDVAMYLRNGCNLVVELDDSGVLLRYQSHKSLLVGEDEFQSAEKVQVDDGERVTNQEPRGVLVQDIHPVREVKPGTSERVEAEQGMDQESEEESEIEVMEVEK